MHDAEHGAKAAAQLGCTGPSESAAIVGCSREGPAGRNCAGEAVSLATD
jgi:hypothetical protein